MVFFVEVFDCVCIGFVGMVGLYCVLVCFRLFG